MYIEESFDTIFNMGYGSGKTPIGVRVKRTNVTDNLLTTIFREEGILDISYSYVTQDI